MARDGVDVAWQQVGEPDAVDSSITKDSSEQMETGKLKQWLISEHSDSFAIIYENIMIDGVVSALVLSMAKKTAVLVAVLKSGFAPDPFPDIW